MPKKCQDLQWELGYSILPSPSPVGAVVFFKYHAVQHMAMAARLFVVLLGIFLASSALGDDEMRTWQDQSGDFKVQAKLISFKSGKVYLEKADGTAVGVPIEKLSFIDYDYLRTRQNYQEFTELREFIQKNPLPTQHTVYIVPALPEDAQHLAFSPGEGRLLAISMNSQLSIMDLKVPVTSQELILGSGRSRRCKFSPDGKRLLSANSNGIVFVWNIENEKRFKPHGSFAFHSGEINCMAVSDDSKNVVTCDRKSLFYWNLESRETIHQIETKSAITHCFINPQGTQAVGYDGTYLILFDLKTGAPIQQMNVGRASNDTFAFAPNRQVALLPQGSMMRKVLLKGGVEDMRIADLDNAYNLAFSENGKLLLAKVNGKLRLYDVKTSMPIMAFNTTAEGYSSKLAFCPDNRHFAFCAGSPRMTLQIFRIPDSAD